MVESYLHVQGGNVWVEGGAAAEFVFYGFGVLGGLVAEQVEDLTVVFGAANQHIGGAGVAEPDGGSNVFIEVAAGRVDGLLQLLPGDISDGDHGAGVALGDQPGHAGLAGDGGANKLGDGEHFGRAGEVLAGENPQYALGMPQGGDGSVDVEALGFQHVEHCQLGDEDAGDAYCGLGGVEGDFFGVAGPPDGVEANGPGASDLVDYGCDEFVRLFY